MTLVYVVCGFIGLWYAMCALGLITMGETIDPTRSSMAELTVMDLMVQQSNLLLEANDLSKKILAIQQQLVDLQKQANVLLASLDKKTK